MQKPLLIIGNKNYSSWSLRAWLLLKAFNIDFEEQVIELFHPSATPILDEHAPYGAQKRHFKWHRQRLFCIDRLGSGRF